MNQGARVEDPDQPWLNLEDPDTLDQLSAASVRYRIAIGPDTGKRTLTLTNPGLAQSLTSERSRPPKPFTVNRDGFSLNAAVSIPAYRRDRLEHLCRYLTRPAHRPADLGHAPCDGPLKRVFDIDITLCPHCGQRLRVIAEITRPNVIHTILEPLKQRNPAADTPRAPPAKTAGRAASTGNPDSLTA